MTYIRLHLHLLTQVRRAAVAAETLPGQWRGHWFEDGRQTPQTFAASLELVAEWSSAGTVKLRTPAGGRAGQILILLTTS